MSKLNVNLLSRLVTWAAEDEVRHADPARAVELGLAKTKDPNLGSWNQQAWGTATRNGVCQTAFCIAGGAVALDDESVAVMSKIYGSEYMMESVVPKSVIPEGSDMRWGYWWLSELQDSASQIVGREHVETTAQAAERLLGIDHIEANALFHGDNTIEDVVSYAVRIGENHKSPVVLEDWIMQEFYDEDRADSLD